MKFPKSKKAKLFKAKKILFHNSFDQYYHPGVEVSKNICTSTFFDFQCNIVASIDLRPKMFLRGITNNYVF